MKKQLSTYIFFLLFLIGGISAQAQVNTDPNLKVWFSFNNYTEGTSTIMDVSGNNFAATLKNEATISATGGIDGVLDLGSSDGFLDLGALFGSQFLHTLED